MKKLFALLVFSLGLNQVQAAATNANIQVTATLSATCSINATNVAFSNIGTVANNVTSTTSNIQIKCSNKLPYTVGLSSGNQGNNSMKGSSRSDTIPYALCQQSGWSLNGTNVVCSKSWITSTMTGTGNGTNQNYTVYGYVLNGYYTPDSYSDNVTTTIWY